MARPFPVLASAAEAWRLVFGNPGALLRAGLLPLALLLLLALADAETRPHGAFQAIGGYAHFLLPVVSLIPAAFFAVAWQRFVLLGPEGGQPRWVALSHGLPGRIFLFLLLALLVDLLGRIGLMAFFSWLLDRLVTFDGMFAPASLGATLLLSVAFTLAMALTVGGLLARLGPVLPAASLDDDRSAASGLPGAWDLTAGQGYRIVAAWILALAPFVLAALALDAEPTLFGTLQDLTASMERRSAWHPALDEKVIDCGVAVLDFLSLALAVTILSLAYRHCGPSPPRARSSGSDC